MPCVPADSGERNDMSEDLRFLIFAICWMAGVVLFIRWMNAR